MRRALSVTSALLFAAAARADPPDREAVVRGRATRPGDDPSAASVRVSADQLERSARNTLLEAAAAETPGMYVNARGPQGFGVGPGSSGSIRLRALGGSPNTQVLVANDGVPDYMGIFGHPLPDTYQSDLAGEVLVIPGGDSVLYGSNAMGGVIDIRSRWRDADGTDWRLRAEGGSYGTFTAQAAVLHRRGRYDVTGSVNLNGTEGHRDFTGYRYEGATLRGRVRWTPAWTTTARVQVGNVRTYDPGTVTRPQADHWVTALRVNASVTTAHEHGAWSGQVTAFVNVGRHALYDGFRSLDGVVGVDARERWRPASRVEVLVGLQGLRVAGEITRPAAPDVAPSVHSAAAYTQAVVRLWGERILLVAGLRGVWNERYGLRAYPRFGAVVRPWSGAEFHARAAWNYRDPTLSEWFLPFPVANPDLRPERSTTAELGFRQSVRGVGSVAVTGYLTRATDWIRTFGAFPSITSMNVNDVTVAGVEFRARLDLLAPVHLQVSGMLNDNGTYTRQNPSRTVQTLVELQLPRLAAEVRYEHVGGLYQDDYALRPLDDIHRVSVRVTGSFVGGALRPFVLVDNVLDQRYAYVYDYVMPGVTALVGARVTLRGDGAL